MTSYASAARPSSHPSDLLPGPPLAGRESTVRSTTSGDDATSDARLHKGDALGIAHFMSLRVEALSPVNTPGGNAYRYPSKVGCGGGMLGSATQSRSRDDS